jgi:hypothetical protein
MPGVVRVGIARWRAIEARLGAHAVGIGRWLIPLGLGFGLGQVLELGAFAVAVGVLIAGVWYSWPGHAPEGMSSERLAFELLLRLRAGLWQGILLLLGASAGGAWPRRAFIGLALILFVGFLVGPMDRNWARKSRWGASIALMLLCPFLLPTPWSAERSPAARASLERAVFAVSALAAAACAIAGRGLAIAGGAWLAALVAPLLHDYCVFPTTHAGDPR